MRKTLITLGLLSAGPLAAADRSLQRGFSQSPWISARADALGGALSPMANGLDAFYANPGLIGDYSEKGTKPFITHLFFPYLGVSGGAESHAIATDELSGIKLQDQDERWQDVNRTGTSVHGRYSATPVVIMNRFMFGYTHGARVGAFRNTLEEDGLTPAAAPYVRLQRETLSGPLLGFSATAPDADFYLGVSAAFLRSERTDVALDSTTLSSEDARKQAIKDGTESYEGMPVNVGLAYRFKAPLTPILSATVTDIGGTRYSPSDKTLLVEESPQSITLGVGISPKIGKEMKLNAALEGTRLGDSTAKADERIRAGVELTMGERPGADSWLALRMGYSGLGFTYGAGVNFGIFSAQIASYTEDLGAGKDRVLERVSSVNIGINIADY